MVSFYIPPRVIYKVTCSYRVRMQKTRFAETRGRGEYNFPHFPRIFLSAGLRFTATTSRRRRRNALMMRYACAVCIRCSPDPVHSV